MNFRTILVPTDFSSDADAALETAIGLAEKFDSRIVVVHAYHIDLAIASPVVGSGTLPQGYWDELREQATAHAANVSQRASDRGIEASSIAVAGTPSAAIVEQASQVGADLIVMGTRGLSGLKHVMLGSVAERVVRTASCPVMTVKAASE